MPRTKKSSGKRFQTHFFWTSPGCSRSCLFFTQQKISGSLLISTLLGFVYPNLDFFCSRDGRLFWGSKRDAKPEDSGSGAPAKPLLHTIAPSDGGLRPLGWSRKGVYLKHYKKTKKSDTCDWTISFRAIYYKSLTWSKPILGRIPLRSFCSTPRGVEHSEHQATLMSWCH